MKTYPYNRASAEGKRLFRLLDAQFNKGSLHALDDPKTFESYDVLTVTQCRVNKIGFLFPSNLSGIKRPQIRVDSDVEMAWGDFSEGIGSLDFTHDDQELPLSYVQPLEDDTLKMLIDAGLYREKRFEEVMNKLMVDEEFDAEAEMNVTYLNVSQPGEHENIPVILVDPVSVVHDEHDASEQTTIANLVKRSARLAMELQKEGVKTEELVHVSETEQDREVFITDDFEDVVSQEQEEELRSDPESFTASSDLLDKEIDVTDELQGSLSFDHTSEDDRIRDLKERDRFEAEYAEPLDTNEEVEPVMDDKPLTSSDDATHSDSEKTPTSSSKTKESSTVLDSNLFDKGLDDYEYETEDDGPEL